MLKLLALDMLGSALACGAEFTSLKELQEHMKAHPEHKVVRSNNFR
jgi:hypothetical protein